MHNLNLFYLPLFDFDRGNVHRHIVLAIKHEDKWAALGISRRSNLMSKPFEFNSLLELIREYETSYVRTYMCL
jgi:hypothetical protein